MELRKVWKYQREIIRSCKSKDRQYYGQKEKGQTTIYKTLHRKLKIEQHKPHWKLCDVTLQSDGTQML
jgi:hypothetical protein